jgi:hypothetical protein
MFGTLAVILACIAPRPPEDPSEWYAPGDPLEVTEPMVFTDEPYDFGESGGIGEFNDSVFPVDDFVTLFGAGDGYPPDADCDSEESDALPREIEGVATIFPRFYTKVNGCGRDDEKYYGSFFIEDASGGLFVLGDTKLAEFKAGNKVRIRVRAVRTTFDFDLAYSYDLLEVDRDVTPIHYAVPAGPLAAADHSRVVRVSGVVDGDPDTFGAFQIRADDGTKYDIQIDQELGRRGVAYAPGMRIQVTGPVLFSYSIRSVLIMNIGQVTVLGNE